MQFIRGATNTETGLPPPDDKFGLNSEGKDNANSYAFEGMPRFHARKINRLCLYK